MTNKLTLGIGILTVMTVASCYPPQNSSPNDNPSVDGQQQVDQVVQAAANGEVEQSAPEEQASTQSDTSFSNARTTPKERSITPPPSPSSKPSSSSSPKPSTPSSSSSTKPKETVTSTYKAPTEIVPTIKPLVASKPKSFPYAAVVPGKPGFVFNPYNQKKVDVRGLPAGTLVSDPRDETQKFYVP